MKENTTAPSATMDTHGLTEHVQNVLRQFLDAKSVTSTAPAEDAKKAPSCLSTELIAKSSSTTAKTQPPWNMSEDPPQISNLKNGLAQLANTDFTSMKTDGTVSVSVETTEKR